ncbi:hypothetical protein ACI79P_13315 [Blastococcus sp. SYSU DS0510]
MTSAHRVTGVLVAGPAAALLLAGCGGDASDRTAAAASSASSAAAASSAQATRAPDLASGLLPADAFGPGATVLALSPEQLRVGSGIVGSGADVIITPESCRAAVDGTQPALDAFDDVAAQSATTGSTTTVQMLVRGGPVGEAVEQLAGAAERCPEARLTSPRLGEATITFEELPVAELGDGSALLRYTTTIAAPDGTRVTVPTLVAAVEDDDRALVLLSVDTGLGGAPAGDPAAFAELLEQAYEVQADALG